MIKSFLVRIVATFFGSGYSPVAPGTVGSTATLLPVLALLLLAPAAYPALFSPVVFLPLIVFIYILGTYATCIYMKQTGKHDPKEVVIDETVGQLIAIFLPMQVISSTVLAPTELHLALLLLGFVLFRIFDILKPWPASYFDVKVNTANGVMLDDVVAGVYAGLISIFFLSLL